MVVIWRGARVGHSTMSGQRHLGHFMCGETITVCQLTNDEMADAVLSRAAASSCSCVALSNACNTHHPPSRVKVRLCHLRTQSKHCHRATHLPNIIEAATEVWDGDTQCKGSIASTRRELGFESFQQIVHDQSLARLYKRLAIGMHQLWQDTTMSTYAAKTTHVCRALSLFLLTSDTAPQ